jgi:signal transduction histidine kinase
MAAHDLRNPLGIILAYSDFLETEACDALDETQREFVSTIKSTSEFMLKLINDLLDVSTIESGQLRLEPVLAQLNEVVRRNVMLNRVLAHQKHIDLDFMPAEDLPPILIDQGKIEQVLNNLIGNAVKYSHPNTRVAIRVARDGGGVRVSVADHGQGIPDQDLPKLFKAFGRANVKTTGGEQSTGLGLAIARKIVEGHGGKMSIESRVGEGSTFSFSLPVDATGYLL